MKRYGLIGRTLKHSFSKDFFAKKFAEENIADCSYENFELKTIEEFPLLFSGHPDIKGLNITIPYKEKVVQFLTNKNDIVEAINACNCIKVDGDKLSGYNTDVIGFRKTLEPQLKPYHKKALILGTGGASKAIRYVLEQLSIQYQLVSRRKEKGNYSYEEIGDDIFADHHLIINTTPLGMYPNVDAAPPIPYQLLTSKHFLFDLVYNPAKTKFLIEGEKLGAQISNGYEMLIHQAEESWKIWNTNL
jgi:shikimate dehydrogenase